MKEIENHMKIIEHMKNDIYKCFKQFFSNNLTLIDIYCITTLNRTFHILCGFIDLMKNDNYLCAASLIRIQVDSLLRLNAINLINDKNEFIKKIMDGEHIDKFKSTDNKPLRNSYLALEISKLKGFEWVNDIYDDGCKYIHLTDKHIFSTFKTTELQNTVAFSLKPCFNEKTKITAIENMRKITIGIIDMVNYLKNNDKTC